MRNMGHLKDNLVNTDLHVIIWELGKLKVDWQKGIQIWRGMWHLKGQMTLEAKLVNIASRRFMLLVPRGHHRFVSKHRRIFLCLAR
jgi:hypothetical protein